MTMAKKVAVNEAVFDSPVTDIQWMRQDQKAVLLQTRGGKLYRSTNFGAAWSEITDQLKTSVEISEPITVDRLNMSPCDPNVVMVTGTKRTHFISRNAGETWRRVRQSSTIHTWMFHKKRPTWALLSSWTDACEATKGKDNKGNVDDADADEDKGPCKHMLYLTKDLGRTFKLVTSYVVQFSWGDSTHNQDDRIYFSHLRKRKGDQAKMSVWSKNVDFSFTDDEGQQITLLVDQGNKFLVSHGFTFVARLKDHDRQTVNLVCSSDGGKNFRPTQLPQELEEKSYTILDTSEGVVMLHVNHGAKQHSGVGDVYVSDKDGVRFSRSLPNNVRNSNGDCAFDKVLSLDGIYLANIKESIGEPDAANDEKGASSVNPDSVAEGEELEASSTSTEVDKRRSTKAKGKDESVLRTVITFDKGGSWSYLKPPTTDSVGKRIDCPSDRCWLHLHSMANRDGYPSWYSLETSVGIIMGTGNVGPHLRFEPDEINTYLSRDGGLTFVEVHKGAFIYEIGDHGGLLVMADDIHKTKEVVFSWNEGQSWFDFQVGSEPMQVDNVLIEPNATSTTFLMYGTRDNAGVLYQLDFSALDHAPCKGVWAADSVSSDYETWTPTDGGNSEHCMLGRQITYTRRKPTSECFNGEKFERPVVKKNCACTQQDFDCEIGFARKIGSMECKLAKDYMNVISVPATCTSSDFHYADGYRRVVGDSCEGGWQPQKVAVPCPPDSRLSRGGKSVLGSIMAVLLFLGGATYISRSERLKGYFSNYGFDSFGTVKYASIGGSLPESALDSVGTRYDDDFLEEDFAKDASRLTRQPRQAETSMPRGVDTAPAMVPRLQAPPGSQGSPGDDGADLL